MSLVAVGACYIDTILTSVDSMFHDGDDVTTKLTDTEHRITQAKMKSYEQAVSPDDEAGTVLTRSRFCNN